MRYDIEKGKIIIRLPNKNKGKFRYKTRKTISEFGQSFATATKHFNNSVYLEWQVGYDTLPKDLDRKPTSLEHLSFVGANKKSKHPYELSELLFECVYLDLISKKELEEAIKEIELMDKLFNDEFSIDIMESYEQDYNDFLFVRGDIVLPSFFYKNPSTNSHVEVAIKQQQYASGVQPMVYISIPITDFENGEDSYGKTSKEFNDFVYIIDNLKAPLILNAFKIFGMCSSSHKHDTLEILNLILDNIDNET